MKGMLEMGQVYEVNPYVIQATKISKSLGELTRIFGQRECGSTNYSKEDVDYIYSLIKSEQEDISKMYADDELKSIIAGIIEDIESFGENLSVKNKRELEKECLHFEEIKKVVGSEFTKIKKRKVRSAYIHEEKEACLTALENYAGASKEIARKIDKSIYEDSRTQKKIYKALKKIGVKVIKFMVMVSEQGGYEVMLSAKCKQGYCVTVDEVGVEVSRVMGKTFTPEINERMVLGKKYTTLNYMEEPKFKLVYGVSQIAKKGSERSGDNFLVMDIKGGKKAIIVSDGMGTGEGADQISGKILDAMEALLDTGMNIKNVVTICNSMLISSQKGMNFGTLDICVIDKYSGMFELAKAGGANTFIVGENKVNSYESTTLPLGVVNGSEIDLFTQEIEDETFVIMVTDGVLDLLEEDGREEMFAELINGKLTKNPKELSEVILHSVLEKNDGIATDDMMVVVIGCWQRKCS